MADYPDHVRIVSEQEGGAYVKRYHVRCSRCGNDQVYPRFPPDMTEKYLAQRGWRDGSTVKRFARSASRRRRNWPKKKKKKLTAKQAAWLHFNKPKEQPAMKADEPRQPTREENRRISESLDQHYDVAKGCYSQNFSDDSLAAKLNLPRAWVSNIREQFFGPNVSAAKLEAPKKLTELEQRCKAAEESAMKAAEQAEALAREVRQMRISLDYQGAA